MRTAYLLIPILYTKKSLIFNLYAEIYLELFMIFDEYDWTQEEVQIINPSVTGLLLNH